MPLQVNQLVGFWQGGIVTIPVVGGTDFLLLETGDFILLETGDKIFLESSVVAAPTFVALGTFAANVTSVTPGLPAGLLAGDLLILVVESNGPDAAPAAPAGYTLLGTQADVSPVTRLTIFYKVATGAEVAPTVADTGDHTAAVLVAFRGVDTGAPIEASLFGTQTAGTALTTVPGVTTLGANRMVVVVTSTNNAGGTPAGTFTSAHGNANLASITVAFDALHPLGADGGAAAIYGVKASAGPVGNTTFVANNEQRCYVCFAIKP